MSAPALANPTVLVLTSLDAEHQDYQSFAEALLVAAERDPHFVALRTLELSRGNTMHVQKLVLDQPGNGRITPRLLDELGETPAIVVGRTGILIAVVQRAARTVLRDLGEGYAEPVAIPAKYDELMTVWAGLSGGWILLLLDPMFSQEGRDRLDDVLTSDLFLCGEALWHKVLHRMCRHEDARAQFTDSQWARELKDALGGDGKTMVPAFRAGDAYDGHHHVEELDAAARYIAVARYSLEAMSAKVGHTAALIGEPLSTAVAQARSAATRAFIEQVQRDQDLIASLSSVERWHTEQHQKVALDQIQAIGLLITVAGLSLAGAQLWAASLSRDDETRSSSRSSSSSCLQSFCARRVHSSSGLRTIPWARG